MIPTTFEMELWSSEDSPGIVNVYEGDTIDAVHFFVVNYNTAPHTTKRFYTPAQGHCLH